ncbi:MAG: hypothetical protein ACO22X_07810 [Algoriphagus sp.]
MNKSVLIGGIVVLIGGIVAYFLWPPPDNGVDPLSLIEGYHDEVLGEEAKTPSGNQSVYVDFSDGLVQAYSSETNKKVVDYISQKMVGSSIDWYGLGKNHNGVGKLQYANDRDIYNKVISEASYVDIMAPIEEALKKISASSNDALLITDFEEYTPDGKEQKFAYAKDYFTKWIKAGNSITIYFSQYTEKNKKSKLSGEKNLYFVLFTYGAVNENSLVYKFEKAIEGRSELVGLNKFEINPNPYTVSNDYGGEYMTGLDTAGFASLGLNSTDFNVGDPSGIILEGGYLNSYFTKKLPFESFKFGVDLKFLFENYFQAKTNKKTFTKLTAPMGLYLNASNNGSFILKNVSVKVSDLTKDFNYYYKLANLDSLASFKHHSDSVISLAEVLEIDQEIFSQGLKDDPKKIELVTKFHKNYVGTATQDPMILRVDVVIDSTEENYITQLESFKWNSVINAANGVNSSLYESIRNTFQEVKPDGKILYSYYLLFNY